ncbi:S8 family peptidase [Microbacterium halophytorum]|uniref:S8 family peptidase n=1 Tax=Microbacterium halophytorum TaxID=2067568 RepID=UPI001E3DE65B|nr:S8 family serine peptidase [Microbacterium halophytorum]
MRGALAKRVPVVIAGAITAVLLLSGAAATSADDEGSKEPDEKKTEQRDGDESKPDDGEKTKKKDPVRAAEYWLEDYGIKDAWETTKGEGATIAVIDTGIGDGADELEGAVVDGTDVSGNGADDGRTPVGIIDREHGSLVGSVAAARGTAPGKGFVGVAPEADLLSISVGFGASASVPFVDQVPEAMRWAVDHGADVINLSWTTNTLGWDESWDDAFLYAFENDVVVVVAAGNRGSGTDSVGAPATIPGVLAVGGVDEDGKISKDASTQGITIGVSGPSEPMLGLASDGTLMSWEGTSAAAPVVSGVAALIRSAHPQLDADNVINRIVKTARGVDGVELPDADYGYGLVDAEAAVEEDVDIVGANPVSDTTLEEWVRLYRRADSPPDEERPEVGEVELPALPPADPPTEAGSPWLPTPESLREGTLPIVAFTGAGILLALGLIAVVRRTRSARSERRMSSRSD